MLAAASLEHSPAKLEAGSAGFRDLQPDFRTLRSGVRGLLPRRFRTCAQVSARRAQGYGMSASGIGRAPARVRGLRLGADAPAMGLASALAMLPASPAALLRWSRGARSRLRRGDRRPLVHQAGHAAAEPTHQEASETPRRELFIPLHEGQRRSVARTRFPDRRRSHPARHRPDIPIRIDERGDGIRRQRANEGQGRYPDGIALPRGNRRSRSGRAAAMSAAALSLTPEAKRRRASTGGRTVRVFRRCVAQPHDFARTPGTSLRSSPCPGGCRTPRPSRTSAA